MYFIINNENYVIAASEKFIQKIGARDICIISSMYKNGSIVIDEDNKSIKILTKELNLDFEKSKLYSSFGELTHFRLYDKEDKILEIEENDDISYLKKIKKGVIEKEDNEFDIPKIAALKKEEEDTKELKETAEVAKDEIPEIINEIESIHILNEEPKEENIKTQQHEEQNINDTISQKDNEIDELIQLKDEILPIKDNEPSKDIKEIEPNDNSENELISLKEEIESNIEDIKIPPIPIDKVREKQKRKEQLKQNKENEIKEKLVRIEDLTPIEDIVKEDEEDDSINLLKEAIEKDEIKEEQEIKKVEAQEELRDVISLKDSNIQKNNKEFEIKPKTEDEKLNELLHELETIEPKEEDDIAIKDEATDSKEDITKVIPKDDIIEPKEDITLNVSKENSLEKKEDEIVLNTKPSSKKDNEQNIITKIIKVQVESLNLEDNAKRLNIDLDSYKMLLNSYINEFDRVSDLLKIGDSKTIDMLIDAGQLLALDSIVLKLTKLKNTTEIQDIKQKAKEIELYINELKNKIDNKKVDNYINEVNTVSNVEPIKKEKEEELSSTIELKNIEDDVEKTIKDRSKIEEETNRLVEEKDILESAKTLLDNVDKKDVILEIEETAMELNIPESLVLEFTKDFLNQAKEHLPILINEYKNGNIKELQQTAHMLKGAANNLRLNSIADILFKIQKSDNLETDKSFIIKFASLIKGLEEALNRVERK